MGELRGLCVRKLKRSFTSIEKAPFNLSVPVGLVDGFRLRAREAGLKANELITYMLCDLLDADPTEYGLPPWEDHSGDARDE